ncbi:MAG: hypothetical protein CVU46_16385 [Chloroflexi bacterium HGW-Chloroflexi-8]|nr:MAG: hypothetical protein CVU46_16385 [Chloroflexi bacterium HGW-Chloroflexi-8]
MLEPDKNLNPQPESSEKPLQNNSSSPSKSQQPGSENQKPREEKQNRPDRGQGDRRNQNRNGQNRQSRSGQKSTPRNRPHEKRNQTNPNSNNQKNENNRVISTPEGSISANRSVDRPDRLQRTNGDRSERSNGERPNDRQDRFQRTNGEKNERSNGERNGVSTEPWGMNPRRTVNGIQTRSQRGEFAKNWWARRWLEALERLMLGVRLTRGQHYARIGQIVSMEEIKGGMAARVQGSRPKPYRVTIQLTPFNNKQWEKVFDILSDKAIYVAQLLAGDMPLDIEEVFNSAGVSLFPSRTIDLQTKCTCPDKITPCKHVAATHYILGDRFDEDPFLIFRMRGKSQEQILEALRQRRGADIDLDINPQIGSAWQSQPEVVRFPETLEHFWDAGQELKQVNVQVRMPNIPQPLLKRLGEPEVASQLTLQGQLEESYNSISQFAIMIAFADTSGGATNGNAYEEA